jgi:hypothetical protein
MHLWENPVFKQDLIRSLKSAQLFRRDRKKVDEKLTDLPYDSDVKGAMSLEDAVKRMHSFEEKAKLSKKIKKLKSSKVKLKAFKDVTNPTESKSTNSKNTTNASTTESAIETDRQARARAVASLNFRDLLKADSKFKHPLFEVSYKTTDLDELNYDIPSLLKKIETFPKSATKTLDQELSILSEEKISFFNDLNLYLASVPPGSFKTSLNDLNSILKLKLADTLPNLQCNFKNLHSLNMIFSDTDDIFAQNSSLITQLYNMQNLEQVLKSQLNVIEKDQKNELFKLEAAELEKTYEAGSADKSSLIKKSAPETNKAEIVTDDLKNIKLKLTSLFLRVNLDRIKPNFSKVESLPTTKENQLFSKAKTNQTLPKLLNTETEKLSPLEKKIKILKAALDKNNKIKLTKNDLQTLIETLCTDDQLLTNDILGHLELTNLFENVNLDNPKQPGCHNNGEGQTKLIYENPGFKQLNTQLLKNKSLKQVLNFDISNEKNAMKSQNSFNKLLKYSKNIHEPRLVKNVIESILDYTKLINKDKKDHFSKYRSDSQGFLNNLTYINDDAVYNLIVLLRKLNSYNDDTEIEHKKIELDRKTKQDIVNLIESQIENIKFGLDPSFRAKKIDIFRLLSISNNIKILAEDLQADQELIDRLNSLNATLELEQSSLEDLNEDTTLRKTLDIQSAKIQDAALNLVDTKKDFLNMALELLSYRKTLAADDSKDYYKLIDQLMENNFLVADQDPHLNAKYTKLMLILNPAEAFETSEQYLAKNRNNLTQQINYLEALSKLYQKSLNFEQTLAQQLIDLENPEKRATASLSKSFSEKLASYTTRSEVSSEQLEKLIIKSLNDVLDNIKISKNPVTSSADVKSKKPKTNLILEQFSKHWEKTKKTNDTKPLDIIILTKIKTELFKNNLTKRNKNLISAQQEYLKYFQKLPANSLNNKLTDIFHQLTTKLDNNT